MTFIRTSVAATLLLATATTGAHAAGFSTEGVNPGGALFNDKRFVIQGSAAYVTPQRKYSDGFGTDQLNGVAVDVTGTDAADSFLLLDADLKLGLNENFDCLGRVHQPWRLTNNTSNGFVGRYEQSSFEINSVGADLVCSYKMMINDTMRVRMLGGLRSTSLEATRKNAVIGAALPGTPAFLAGADFTNTYDFESESQEFGYRVGASFEIPSILLRAQLIYDSAISMNMVGTQVISNDLAGVVRDIPVTTSFDLPQAVSFRVQSGVNSTTLVWVGAKWQEWSTIPGLTIRNANGTINNELVTGWNDAWTLEVGAARKLTDDLNAQVSLTWNQGIGGGYTDTWSFGTGLAYDLDDNWRVSVGGSATLLTSSTEFSTGGGAGASSAGYEQGDDWAFAAGIKLQYALD